MKKFFVLLFVFLLTTGNAFAFTEVRYNNAGRAVHSTRGAVRPINSSFGRGALFTPRNSALAGQRNRMAQRQKAMTHAMRNMYNQQSMNGQSASMQGGASNQVVTTKAATLSRFNKNYKISAQTKVRTSNGITYYN